MLENDKLNFLLMLYVRHGWAEGVILFLGPRLMEQLPPRTLLVTVAEGKKEAINCTLALKSFKGNKIWHLNSHFLGQRKACGHA